MSVSRRNGLYPNSGTSTGSRSAGTYTLDGEKVTHHVDISWNEDRTGSNEVRFYKVEGNILTITTAPNKSPVDVA